MLQKTLQYCVTNNWLTGVESDNTVSGPYTEVVLKRRVRTQDSYIDDLINSLKSGNFGQDLGLFTMDYTFQQIDNGVYKLTILVVPDMDEEDEKIDNELLQSIREIDEICNFYDTSEVNINVA